MCNPLYPPKAIPDRKFLEYNEKKSFSEQMGRIVLWRDLFDNRGKQKSLKQGSKAIARDTGIHSNSESSLSNLGAF
jgi:hypothetical protein